MALRDQPYLPLYVQDFLTDEKLAECSAMATGVYIRLMCIMHKSEQYGTILLKQKDKQSTEQIKNFASKIAKQMPFSESEVFNGLSELILENVVFIDGDFLKQKRMIKDCEISTLRSKSGSQGGTKTQQKNKEFAKAKITKSAKAKTQANSENENENEIVTEIKIGNEKKGEAQIEILTDAQLVIQHLNEIANRQFDIKTESHLKNINARLKDGFTKEELFEIIEMKTMQWCNDDKMKQFLTPDTLFNNEKCNKYREQLIQAKANPQQFKNSINGKKQQNTSQYTNGRTPFDGISQQ